jgi:hypothetical protein
MDSPARGVGDGDKTWKSMLGDVTYLFAKLRTGSETFSYTCARMLTNGEPGPSSGFDSNLNFTPEEVEQLSQFDNIIARHAQ